MLLIIFKKKNVNYYNEFSCNPVNVWFVMLPQKQKKDEEKIACSIVSMQRVFHLTCRNILA